MSLLLKNKIAVVTGGSSGIACASIFPQRFVLENIPYSRRRMAIDAIA
jgi:NADP-dependent 3-hydroxy acid dehydrogenase YdfG